ncbi:MAG: zinc ribbon domain-containing protein [Thermoplasmatota archaeon]
MEAFRNKKNSILAIFSILMLLGAAFLGLAMIPGITAAPGDVDEPIWDAVNLTASIDADITFVYSTTMDQNITLTWDWADPLPVDGHLSDVMVGISDYDTFEEQIYGWNLTTDGGSPLKTAIWNQNGTLAPGEYYFGVMVKFWNETDQIYTFDISDVMLTIAVGSPMINSVMAAPATVLNDGMSDVQFTLNMSRMMTEVADEGTSFMLWNEDDQMWSELQVPEPDEANITMNGMYTIVKVNLTIPLDFPVGEYFGYFYLKDKWGYEETFNGTLFTVGWYDRPLMEAEDTTILVDETEMMAAFDPLDLFYDPDGPVNLTVSLGYDEVFNNVTNVTEMVPIWTYEDENITIELNQTNFANSMAKVNVDVEEGSWSFETTAWIDGEPVLDGMAYVEIVPVNDVPMLVMDEITVYKNTLKTVNLSEYFEDADGPMLNLTVNTTVSGALLTYDWETFMLTINPATNWTGSIDVEINATDGIDHALYTLTIEVMLMSYEITGTLTFDEVTGVEVNMSNITLKIGGSVIAFNMTTGAFAITLEEGEYAVELTIPEMYLYSEDDERSGYLMPELENITLMGDTTYDIDVEYLVFEPQVEEATWDDIDWTTKTTKDVDGNIEITVGVKDENKTGYENLDIQLIIKGKGDDTFSFNMTWNPTDKLYTLELSEDDLEDVPEGKRDYYFTDGTNVSPIYEYEFKEKDENANLITVIVLIVLIILVLIALVFIMRKPSEEEFDEEEEEEEEEGERSCPSCGETVTDEEAEECPYCGENLGEE